VSRHSFVLGRQMTKSSVRQNSQHRRLADMEYLIFSPIPSANLPTSTSQPALAPPSSSSDSSLQPGAAIHVTLDFAEAFTAIGGGYEVFAKFVDDHFDENARFLLSLSSSTGLRMFGRSRTSLLADISDIQASFIPRFLVTLHESGMLHHDLAVSDPRETMLSSPLPDLELPTPGFSVTSANSTWTTHFDKGEVILRGSVDAVWVPVKDETRLKLEILEMVWTIWEKRGEIDVGSYGLPEEAMRVLEVSLSEWSTWLIRRLRNGWRICIW